MNDHAAAGAGKTERDVKGRMKASVRELYDVMVSAEDCISLLQSAFIYNNSKLLEECKAKVDGMQKKLARFKGETEARLAGDPGWPAYAAIPDHLSRIAENIEKLVGHVRKKVNERILFSHKAVQESIFLLQRLTEILSPTADMLLARNTYLSMYIQESQSDVGQRAIQYATLHEERLIKGICNDAASVTYIEMLEAIKNIAWQSKEIALKLAKA